MKVAKFGGSNLKDVKDILMVRDLVLSYGEKVVVVVSAMYGVTNSIIEALEKSVYDSSAAETLTCTIYKKYSDSLKTFLKETDLSEAEGILKTRLATLERLLKGVFFLGGIPDFAHDEIISYGERLTSLVLYYALKDCTKNVEEALPEDIGLITDTTYQKAMVNFELSKPLLQKAFSKDCIYIVPGFYGIRNDKKVAIFGRGGSDYTASSIAACIHAESLDLWKDVDGFLTADPAMVENPLRITTLSYDEAAELSYFGAKIMHPKTVEPIRSLNIPIHILNVYEPQKGARTVINENGVEEEHVIKGIATSDDSGILRLKGPGVGFRSGVLGRAASHLDEIGINIKSVVTAQTAIDIIISKYDLEKAYDALLIQSQKDGFDMSMESSLVIIAAVGDGIVTRQGIAARIFSAIYKRNINVEMVSIGASPCAGYFFVRACDKKNTVNAIHDEFYSKK